MFTRNSIQIVILFCFTLLFYNCETQKKVTTSKRKPVRKIPKRTPKSFSPKTSNKVKTPTIGIKKPVEVAAPKTIQLEPAKNRIIEIPKNTKDYISKYTAIAIKEMEIYKIRASITLAQGILESNSGRGPLAIRSNNHFGIKCHRGWKGKSVTHDDDAKGECFRKYEYPELSYEDHSKFLTGRKRYARLFKLRITDYKGWAYGLKRAGYATDPKYPQKLIGLIKRYKLYQFDKNISNNSLNTPVTIGQKAVHVVAKGDTLYSISKRYGITVQQLRAWNNLSNNVINIGLKLRVH